MFLLLRLHVVGFIHACLLFCICFAVFALFCFNSLSSHIHILLIIGSMFQRSTARSPLLLPMEPECARLGCMESSAPLPVFPHTPLWNCLHRSTLVASWASGTHRVAAPSSSHHAPVSCHRFIIKGFVYSAYPALLDGSRRCELRV
jgi:hypothetical protein